MEAVKVYYNSYIIEKWIKIFRLVNLFNVFVYVDTLFNILYIPHFMKHTCKLSTFSRQHGADTDFYSDNINAFVYLNSSNNEWPRKSSTTA